MKYHNEYSNNKKRKEQEWKREHQAGGFKCSHCKQWVVINSYMGTMNRNHCNICLWSKHVDEKKGDRKAECQGGMKPIGLTFKHEGFGKQGEIMLVHECAGCETISINRVASDDENQKILSVYYTSLTMAYAPNELSQQDIYLLTARDEREVETQLFGKR